MTAEQDELIDALVAWSDAVDAYRVDDSHLDRVRQVALSSAAPAEVAAWLDQHPDQVPAVVAAVRRAAPAWSYFNGGCMLTRQLDGRTIAAVVADADDWSWWAGLGDDRVEGTATEREDGRRFAIEALRLRGWVTP